MHKIFCPKFILLGLFWGASLNLCSAQDYQPPDMASKNIPSKNEVINSELDSLSNVTAPSKAIAEDVPSETPNGYAPASVPDPTKSPAAIPDDQQISTASPQKKIKISGELYSSIGIYGDGHLVATRANGNQTERDYRQLSFDQLDNGVNTFDPALFSRLKVVMDASLTKAVTMHLNVSIDPWSYTGKSKEVTLTGVGGDTVKFQYLYWANTGYTINQSFNTLGNGDVFSVPEQKVNGNSVPKTSVGTIYNNIFNIPELKLDYTFQPIRELWFDIKPEDDLTVRLFPLALQDQALTTDDPLGLSNHKIWWAESPWLWNWKPGNYNSTAGYPIPASAPTFTRGKWDNSYAFYTRDSDLLRITGLRGFSFKAKPDEDNSIEGAFASPKTLWQNYSEINAIAGSVRAKHYVDDKAYIGSVNNVHLGYNEGSLDAQNYVGGIDAGYIPWKWLMMNAEFSGSSSIYDSTASSDFKTSKQGKAYYASLVSTSNPEGMIRKDYFGIAPLSKEDDFYKTRLFLGRMDENFESTLANYGDTQIDSFWSRSLTFYPNTYRNMPGVSASISQYDLEPFAIGDGMNYGREVFAWRGDTHLMEGRLEGLADIRNVYSVNKAAFVERVARTQWTYQATDKLTTKALFLWQTMPKTTAGQDAFVYDHNLGQYLSNTAVPGGDGTSSKELAIGARYELTPWANINGVWMITNDSSLNTNNYPQGLFSSAYLSTFSQGGQLYTQLIPQLYQQGLFPHAPFSYHNIFKVGLELIPFEQWHIYIDYTRNPNEFAGNLDDNMNHWGIESTYVPNKRIGFFARYTYSRWYDFNLLAHTLPINPGDPPPTLRYKGYHNVNFETRILLTDDSHLSLEYGAGPSFNLSTTYVDPLLTYYSNPTLTTQHLIRLTYDKKF